MDIEEYNVHNNESIKLKNTFNDCSLKYFVYLIKNETKKEVCSYPSDIKNLKLEDIKSEISEWDYDNDCITFEIIQEKVSQYVAVQNSRMHNSLEYSHICKGYKTKWSFIDYI